MLSFRGKFSGVDCWCILVHFIPDLAPSWVKGWWSRGFFTLAPGSSRVKGQDLSDRTDTNKGQFAEILLIIKGIHEQASKLLNQSSQSIKEMTKSQPVNSTSKMFPVISHEALKENCAKNTREIRRAWIETEFSPSANLFPFFQSWIHEPLVPFGMYAKGTQIALITV